MTPELRQAVERLKKQTQLAIDKNGLSEAGPYFNRILREFDYDRVLQDQRLLADAFLAQCDERPITRKALKEIQGRWFFVDNGTEWYYGEASGGCYPIHIHFCLDGSVTCSIHGGNEFTITTLGGLTRLVAALQQ